MSEMGRWPAIALSEEQRREIAGINWWHHIPIGPLRTPGRTSAAHQEWIAQQLPADLRGASVLDIGAWDGYFSFLAEARGASSVLAIDELQNPSAHTSGTEGFELAKRLLGSRVEYRVKSLSEAPTLGRRFDVVLCLGVYYHVPDPMAALRTLGTLVSEGGRIFLEGMYLPGRRPILTFFRPGEIEPTTYSAATIPGLLRMGSVAGLGEGRVLSTERGANPLLRWAARHSGALARPRPARPARPWVPKVFWPRVLIEFAPSGR